MWGLFVRIPGLCAAMEEGPAVRIRDGLIWDAPPQLTGIRPVQARPLRPELHRVA